MPDIKPLPIEIQPWHIQDNRIGTAGNQQWIYRFANGYGASVIQGPHSYGGPEGLYELAVIQFADSDEWHLTYRTPVTDDVLGYLPLQDVAAALAAIAALEPVHA